LVWYLKSRELNPSEPKIDQSIAIAKLAMGKLKEGLYEFEVLHHVKPRKAISDSGIPWWNGEDLNGKRVILAHEQGFGDTLQFIRFAPLLKAKCRRLVFSGPEELAPLIAEQFDCFDDVINEVGPFEADYVTSPMSSCALMGIEYKDINGLAYMSANPLELPRKLSQGWHFLERFARLFQRWLAKREPVGFLSAVRSAQHRVLLAASAPRTGRNQRIGARWFHC
jgi:hypothetical protein